MNVVKIYRETENIGLLTNEEELKDYQKLVAELGMQEVKENKTPKNSEQNSDLYFKKRTKHNRQKHRRGVPKKYFYIRFQYRNEAR